MMDHKQFGYDFRFVCELGIERDDSGKIVTYNPQNEFLNKNGLKLNSYGAGPFCKFSISRNWSGKSGVYILLIDNDPMYVGECEDLGSRYNTGYGNISPRNCFEGGQSTNCRINNLIMRTCQDGKKVSLIFLETADRFRIEDELISKFKPPWNKNGGRPSNVPLHEDPSPPSSPEVTSSNDDTFEAVWQNLTSGLRAKVQIRNWTVDKGYLKGDLTARYQGGDYVIVDAMDARSIQKVSKKDFEFLYDNWRGYVEGRIPRQQLRDGSRFTKYTISILHHFLKTPA